MESYNLGHANNSQQPFDPRHRYGRRSDTNNNNNNNKSQYSASQDSWRSYSNDTTNLQQTAGFIGQYAPNYNGQQQTQVWSQHGLNPFATPFQPMHIFPASPVQSHFTPYQPLRMSNGHLEQLRVQQTRSQSNKAATSDGQHRALRSRGPVSEENIIPDVPIPSMEQQHAQFSSVPINLLPSLDLLEARTVAPRQPSPVASPLPVPVPSHTYLAQASIAPASSSASQKLLVVLDLNGTLLKRTRNLGTNFALRPGVATFMHYLLDNHVVMVYTSARPENANVMVAKIFSPKQRAQIAAVWARDKLDLTPAQYHSKLQVYKKLEKIWDDVIIQKRAPSGCCWDQTNTVLIDDSHLKAAAQPYNLLKVDEFLNDCPGRVNSLKQTQSQNVQKAAEAWLQKELRIIRDLENKLEGLRWTEDVSRLIRKWQLADAKGEHPLNDQSFETEHRELQLMTPQSPEPSDSGSSIGSSDECIDSRKADIDMLAESMGDQSTNERAEKDGENLSDRSVSPISEDVWRELLGNMERKHDEPQTRKSFDD